MTRVICQMVLFVKAVMSLSLSPSHGFDASQVHSPSEPYTWHGHAFGAVYTCLPQSGIETSCPQSKEQHLHDQSSSKRVESKWIFPNQSFMSRCVKISAGACWLARDMSVKWCQIRLLSQLEAASEDDWIHKKIHRDTCSNVNGKLSKKMEGCT